jgi:hypothetical protein
VEGVGGGAPATGPEIATGPETVRAEAVAALSAPEPAESSRVVNTAAIVAALGTLSQQPNLQPPPLIGNLIGIPGVRLDVQALAAARSTAQTVREGPQVGGAATPVTVGPEEEQAEDRPPLPSPRVAGALSALAPVDLSALELGMQQLLDQLGRKGSSLIGHRDGTGLWLWIVAGTAATAACEIARRQVRSQGAGIRDQRLAYLTPDP